MTKRTSILLLTLILAMGAAGCTKSTVKKDGDEPGDRTTGRDPAKSDGFGENNPMSGNTNEVTPEITRIQQQMQDIFFDFDKYDLRGDSLSSMSRNSQVLRDNRGARVEIEGHCDERGTNEYNLALGERRANAARDYLVRSGIDAGRLSTVSYGEERPFALGHDESAWQLNRRAHFKVVSAR